MSRDKKKNRPAGVVPPTASEYQDFVKNWKQHIFVPQLLAGAPVYETAQSGDFEPVSRSGKFAIVYFWRGKNNEEYAVRFFTKTIDSRNEIRYIAIRLLTEKSPYFVPFEYIKYGLWSSLESRDTKVYPLIIMDRAHGLHLDEYIENYQDQPEKLLTLANEWYSLALFLSSLNIAHGNLEHDNIIIHPEGKIKLVDYDGMYSKLISPLGSQERGHPNYNHPDRTPAHYGPMMDKFSVAVIYLSIIATAINPDYWTQFHKNDRLLFGKKDFEEPDKSELLQSLLKCPVKFINELASLLVSYCKDKDPLCETQAAISALEKDVIDEILKLHQTRASIPHLEEKTGHPAQVELPPPPPLVYETAGYYAPQQPLAPDAPAYSEYSAADYVANPKADEYSKKGYLYGFCSLIPLIGFIMGILAIIYGLRARSLDKSKGIVEIVLGSFGIVLTLLVIAGIGFYIGTH